MKTEDCANLRKLSALFFLAAAPSFAQDAGIQRQLVQRQQQTDAFALQLRQSQEALNTPHAAKPGLEARQLAERRRLENVSEKQLSDVQPDSPPELRSYERQKADDERRPLLSPAR